MRRFSLLAVLLILAVLGLSACDSDSHSGWVLEYLRNNKMELRTEKAFLDSESRPFEKCGAEWNEHGTFCYPDLTTSYQAEDRSLMNRLVSGVSASLAKVAQFVKKILELFERLKNEKKLAKFKALARVEQELNEEPTRRFVEVLQRFVDRHARPNHNGIADTCWGKMAAMREQAVCFLCSGRHQEFEAASKLVISADTCSAVVGSCKSQFKLLATIAHGATGLLTKLRDSLKQGGFLENVISGGINSTIKLLGTINSPTLLKLIKDISGGNPERVATAEAEFCQNTVALVKEPYLKFLAPIFRKVEKLLEQLEKKAQEIAKRFTLKVVTGHVETTIDGTVKKILNLAPVAGLKTEINRAVPQLSLIHPITHKAEQAVHNVGFNIGARFGISSRTGKRFLQASLPFVPSQNITPHNNFNPSNTQGFVADVIVAPKTGATLSSTVISASDHRFGGTPVPLTWR